MATDLDQLHRTDEEEAEAMENIHEHQSPSKTKNEVLNEFMDEASPQQATNIHGHSKDGSENREGMPTGDSATSRATTNTSLDTKTIPAGAAAETGFSGSNVSSDLQQVPPESVYPVIISTKCAEISITDYEVVVVQEQSVVISLTEGLLPEQINSGLADDIAADENDLTDLPMKAEIRGGGVQEATILKAE